MAIPKPHTPSARTGRAQLSLVEHALSPLNTRESLIPDLRFETNFSYTDPHRNRKRAAVTVSALHGLSPSDDLYLWGLLGLAHSQPEPSADFYATPYWCLKQLGIVHADKKGSEEFRLFREAIRRLSGVRYSCSAFYDPLRHEHREVSFGFLSYSLPLSDGPSRAWRFAWDPIFWELCSTERADGVSFDAYLAGEAREAFDRVMRQLKADLMQGGRGEGDAEAFAKQHALVHFRNKFRQRPGQNPPSDPLDPPRS